MAFDPSKGPDEPASSDSRRSLEGLLGDQLHEPGGADPSVVLQYALQSTRSAQLPLGCVDRYQPSAMGQSSTSASVPSLSMPSLGLPGSVQSNLVPSFSGSSADVPAVEMQQATMNQAFLQALGYMKIDGSCSLTPAQAVSGSMLDSELTDVAGATGGRCADSMTPATVAELNAMQQQAQLQQLNQIRAQIQQLRQAQAHLQSEPHDHLAQHWRADNSLQLARHPLSARVGLVGTVGALGQMIPPCSLSGGDSSSTHSSLVPHPLNATFLPGPHADNPCSNCWVGPPPQCHTSAPLAAGPGVPPPHQPAACDFCGRWLSEMAINQGNHMCTEFWPYTREFQASAGARYAVLVSGLQHQRPEVLAAFFVRFPIARRVRHGASFTDYNGLFLMGYDNMPTLAVMLRSLLVGGVRMIPLGHAASWSCLHVQLAPASSPLQVGQAEQLLLTQLLIDPPADGITEGGSPSSWSADVASMHSGRPDKYNSGIGGCDGTAGSCPQHGAMVDPSGQAQARGNAAASSSQALSGSNAPTSAAGDWKCTSCGNINFAFREKCNRCNLSRPGAKMLGAAAAERRICPHTVMLMRVPPHATEVEVAEALAIFGEVAPGGIKFHRQGAKFKQHRRGRLLSDSLALHAFCRFAMPASASAALKQGEVHILSQPVQINPAFVRAALSPEMLGVGSSSAASSAEGSRLQSSNAASQPATSQLSSAPCSNLGSASAPAATVWQGSSDFHRAAAAAAAALSDDPEMIGGAPAPSETRSGSELLAFLAVLFQAFWFLDPLRQKIEAIPRGAHPLIDGIAMLFASLYGQRTAAPLALLRAALAPRVIEAARASVRRTAHSIEWFEAALGVLSDAGESKLAACLEQHFSMSIMEICECSCGEVLDPLSHKQMAIYVPVPALLAARADRLTAPLAHLEGPSCHSASCSQRMRTRRYLMQPIPAVVTFALVWGKAESMAPRSRSHTLDESDAGAGRQVPLDTAPTGGTPRATENAADMLAMLFSAVEQNIDLRHVFKGAAANTTATLRGMICSAGSHHCGAFLDLTQQKWQWFDETTISPLSDGWTSVVERCAVQRHRPSFLFYAVQRSGSQ